MKRQKGDFMPARTRRYAFIVHLRSFDDIIIACPLIPKFFVFFLRRPLLALFEKIRGRAGFSVRSKFKINEEVEGHILLIWLTGEQIMSVEKAHKVRKRILEAVLFAQNKLECDVIGLGALTSSVALSGQWLANHPKVTAAITHGDSYSVCVALEGTKKIIRTFGFNPLKTIIAIVGATGIIGEGLACQLAQFIGNKHNGLILIGRNSKKLEKVRAKIRKLGFNPTISMDINDINEADIIITATSWPEAIVGSNHLKKGAIIYEVSQPRNAAFSLLKDRPDVLIIDGSYVKVPKNIKFWWMGLPTNTTFACMAETTMQAMEGDFENHIGEINSEFVKEMQRRAEKYGFAHASFTSFNKKVKRREYD